MVKTLEQVRALFPEAEQISDAGLREKVLETWFEAWKVSHFDTLDQAPFLTDVLREISNLDHTRAVTVLSIQFANTMKEFLGTAVNMDYLIAGAILHDVGKLFEFCEAPSALGNLFTHRLSGVYLAAKMDLPVEVIHIIGMHSHEGELKKRTPEAAIVRHMDSAYVEFLLGAKTDIAMGQHTKFHVIQKG